MNSEKLRVNKGNRCLTALPKFREAGLENALIFLEVKMDRYWRRGSHVVRADQETSQTPALGLGRLHVSASVLDSEA